MSTPVWAPTENTFEINTRGNYKKMNILSSDHFSKLKGQQSNPLINSIYLEFSPFRTSYNGKYIAWKLVAGNYHGATQFFEEKIAELTGDKIEAFDIAIQNNPDYRKGSANYKTLLPNFRGPFQTGEYDERITELETLRDATALIPAFAALSLSIAAFCTILINARDNQQAFEGNLQTASDNLELERLECAAAMFASLGSLMKVFKKDTKQIDNYFDLVTLRGKINDTSLPLATITGTAPMGMNSEVPHPSPDVAATPEMTLVLSCTNPTSMLVKLIFYFVSISGEGSAGHITVEVLPGQEIQRTLASMGFTLANSILMVRNEGTDLGTYTLELFA